MKHLELGKLYYEISRHNPPGLTVSPGETVSIETEDAFSGQIRKEGDRRDLAKAPFGNPQSPPVYVEGAMPGDTLSVRIEKIEARLGQAGTRTGGHGGLGEYLGLEVPHGTRICPVIDDMVWWSDTVSIPYRPMIGTLSTAPAMGAPTSGPAGPYGGNMDIKEVTHGNTVYLPVFVTGALLHVGDAHAAQGDGELCGTALEMPATITLTIDLIKEKTIKWPRIRSDDEMMVVVTGTPMERSVAQAYAELILWMEDEYGLPRWDGYNLCTQVGSISVGHYVLGTVAAKVKTAYVESAVRNG